MTAHDYIIDIVHHRNVLIKMHIFRWRWLSLLQRRGGVECPFVVRPWLDKPVTDVWGGGGPPPPRGPKKNENSNSMGGDKESTDKIQASSPENLFYFKWIILSKNNITSQELQKPECCFIAVLPKPPCYNEVEGHVSLGQRSNVKVYLQLQDSIRVYNFLTIKGLFVTRLW